MPIVAISGKRKSGKSTLANILCAEQGYTALSLASPLKRLCRCEFGLTYDQTDGIFKEQPTHLKAPNGEFWTPRDILIHIGATFRKVDKDFWLHKLDEEIETYTSVQGPCQFVIPDVRFKNELDWLTRQGCVSVRLDRDEKYTGLNLDDPSETELDYGTEFDIRVPANENVCLEDLYVVAERIANHVARL